MSFARLQGQDRALDRLRGLLKSRRIPPALLFHGPPGVGKATAAIQFAKALNCEAGGADACDQCASCASADKGLDMDLKRLDSAYQAGVLGEEVEKQQHLKIDSVRHLIKDMEMRSMTGRWKTAVVCDAHTLQAAAANALLKSLEEPPPRATWILVTDRRDALLPTISSRCHAFPFAALSEPIVTGILKDRGVPAAEAKVLAAMSEGSPGRALSFFERKLPDPATWAADPLAPFRLAEELPRELHLSRPLVDDHLHRMAWHLRLELAGGTAAASREPRLRKAVDSIDQLRRRLRSNVDPRLTIELAAIELQRACARTP
ncbi:MAG: AAA family ATPase [Elusimicrobia bacterium]|nr:AAA family ATPase [Elusimicrobiota bacterium]